MAKKELEVIEVEAVEEVEVDASEEVVAQLLITLKKNGEFVLNIPEGAPHIQTNDMEGLTRQVSEQLRDMRIAQSAVEMFKQRLG